MNSAYTDWSIKESIVVVNIFIAINKSKIISASRLCFNSQLQCASAENPSKVGLSHNCK